MDGLDAARKSIGSSVSPFMTKSARIDPTIGAKMAHAPEVLDATLTLNASFQGGLDPKLRELRNLDAV